MKLSPLSFPRPAEIKCGHVYEDGPATMVPWDLACACCRTDYLYGRAIQRRAAKYLNVHWTAVSVSFLHYSLSNGKRLGMMFWSYDPDSPNELGHVVGCGRTRQEVSDDIIRLLKLGKESDYSTWE